MVMLLFMTGVIWFIFYRSITKPLDEVSSFATGIAGGNLAQTLVNDSQHEVGRMTAAVDEMRRRLVEIIDNIRVGSDDLNSLSRTVAQGNGDLNQRTQAQASALEEISATVAGISDSTERNRGDAIEASKLAEEAKKRAENGGEVVGNAITAMDEIGNASEQIRLMIDVIDDMAFQTNLLSLNAAVEAARAGENGKGFVVVASEVRNLANRSASAASEVKTLVENSSRRVDEGMRLVKDSGAVLEDIVNAIEQLVATTNQLVASSQEQNDRVGQVSHAVNQIDSMTQQNASLVEEVASISEEISEQSSALKESVAYFSSGAAVQSTSTRGGHQRSSALVEGELDMPMVGKKNAQGIAHASYSSRSLSEGIE